MSGHRPRAGAAAGTASWAASGGTGTGTAAGAAGAAPGGCPSGTAPSAAADEASPPASPLASRAALRAPAGRPRRPRTPGPAAGAGDRTATPRPGAAAHPGRGHTALGSRPADPVRELMHRHRELCAHAVDPLEIAAVLEADGITDRVAARYRHRDVFSLAEELFARVPREGERNGGTSEGATGAVRAGSPPDRPRTLLPLLAVAPGILAAAAVAVFAAAGTGPGHDHAAAGAAVATGTGLVCALGPAVWCARWFAARTGRGLQRSRTLGEFAAGTRSLLTAAAVMFAGAFGVLLTAARTLTGPAGAGSGGGRSADAAGAGLLVAVPAETLWAGAALGLLLFAALLLAVHGFYGTAAAGAVAACALQAAAASVPGAAGGGGAAGPSAAACGCVALALLVCAYRLLPRASAHRPRISAARAKPPCACGETAPGQDRPGGDGRCRPRVHGECTGSTGGPVF